MSDASHCTRAFHRIRAIADWYRELGPRDELWRRSWKSSRNNAAQKGGSDMTPRLARSALVLLAGLLAAATGAGAQAMQPAERPMPHMQAMNRVYNLLREQTKDPSQNRGS